MRRAAVVLVVWGLWLAVLTGVQAVFAPKLIQFAIPAVASAACVLLGLWCGRSTCARGRWMGRG